jgi:hypothetical protein
MRNPGENPMKTEFHRAVRAGRLFLAVSLLLWQPGCPSPAPRGAPQPTDEAAGTPESTVNSFALSSACGAFELEEDSSIFHLVADRFHTWEPGTTLHVVFMDGKPENMQKVAEIAPEWSKHANIEFAFYRPGETPPAGSTIRVSFQRAGYWSLVGSQAAHRGSELPTMNLNFRLFSQGEAEIRRVILHEFGHALGLYHEHQNPNQGFTWNKEVIYEYYKRTHGWDEATVDSNILAKLDPSGVTASDFDPRSIMIYSFPPEFTKEGVRIAANYELSATDKKEIAALYPGRVEPEEPVVGEGNEEAWASQISFDYVIESVAATGGDQRIKNYAIFVSAPAEVLDKIDHVLYQRQHQTFAEYAHGTYYRAASRQHNFGFAWQGWGWAPVVAKVVYKTGKVSDHTRSDAPRTLAAGPDWNAIKQAVRFRYTVTRAQQGWSTYRIELDAADAAPHIHWIEYQRQHQTFGEYGQGVYLRRDALADNFALSWRGYGWIVIAIRVHFKDGTTAEHRVDTAPTQVGQ